MGIDNYRIMKYKTKIRPQTIKLLKKKSQMTSGIDTGGKQRAVLILENRPPPSCLNESTEEKKPHRIRTWKESALSDKTPVHHGAAGKMAHSGVSGTSQMALSSCLSVLIIVGDESVGVRGAKGIWEVGVKTGRSARFIGLGDRSEAGSTCFRGVGVVSIKTGTGCLATLGVAVFGGSQVRGSCGAAMFGVGPSGWYWMKTSGVAACGGGEGPVGVSWPLLGSGISCGRLACKAVPAGELGS